FTVTAVPTGPLVGVNDPIVGACGGCVTVKAVALVAVPAGLTTLIRPVVAPAGTLVSMRTAETTVKLAAVPLKRTLVVPRKFVPFTVTAVPTGPLAGVNEVIVGGCGGVVTVNEVELVPVPSGDVTLIGPVVAPAGT